jgi:hypothetical protein
MRLFALTAATAAVVAFAIPQIPHVLAQGPDTQSGASAQQGNAGQGRGSGDAATRSDSRGQSVGGRSEDSERFAGAKSKKSQTSVGISAKSREATIRGRSQTRIGVNSGSREDVVVKRKRAHGVVVLNDKPRRHVLIKRRHPGVAITTGETSRTTVRSRVGRDVNVRAGMRSRETTGSSTEIKRGQSSSSSSLRGSSDSKSGNQTRGNARSTTGQGSNR